MQKSASHAVVADGFARILGAFCDLIAARMSRPLSLRQRLATPTLMLLWSYVRRTIARFARLAARAAPPSMPGAGQPRAARLPRARLPGGFGWITRLLSAEAVIFASQLRHLLAGAEAASLLRAAPQAARLLRPLCRGLAIEDVLPDPPKPGSPPERPQRTAANPDDPPRHGDAAVPVEQSAKARDISTKPHAHNVTISERASRIAAC